MNLSTPQLIDVRSPLEFLQGHIPGSYSLPLFSNEERALVGTLYKKEGKETAIKEGLRLVGPKLHSLVEQAEKIAPTKHIKLYCARGGMRSSSVSWLLTTAGFTCEVYSGGYKAYRNLVLKQFEKKYRFIVVGGFTGSGKTAFLQQLKQKKQLQIIDLENLANHKGSSFGYLGEAQPSSEHFENLLGHQLSFLCQEQPIWIEDESRMIGTCAIPQGLLEQMALAPFVWLDVPIEKRIKNLLDEYGYKPHEELIQAMKRLTKRLGKENVEKAIWFLKQEDRKSAISLFLEYYDKTYAYACLRKGRQQTLQQTLPKEILCHLL